MGLRVSFSSLFSLDSFAVFYFAEIAQLVEHNLAKVGVASSSLVFRSLTFVRAFVQSVRIHACPAWGHGFESRTHRTQKVFFMVLDF